MRMAAGPSRIVRDEANRQAARAVEETTPSGRGPSRPGGREPRAAAPGANPRRNSRSRSRCRARLSRLLTVPTGQPRCRAACSWLALQVAEDDRDAVTARGAAPAPRGGRRSRSASPPGSVGLVVALAAQASRSCLRRRAAPTGRTRRSGARPGGARDRATPDPEPAALADQDEERGLERVLGVVRVAQHAAADPQHHRPVPLDQGRERRLGRSPPAVANRSRS